MSKEEQLKGEYLKAINTGHQASRDSLRLAAFSYMESGQAPKLTTRLALRFKKSVQPYCDYILSKYQDPNDGKQEQ